MLTVDEMLVDLDMTGFDGTDLPVLTPEDVAELVAFDRVGQLQDGPSKTPKGNFQELLEAEHQRKAARRLEREREAQERRDQKCRASRASGSVGIGPQRPPVLNPTKFCSLPSTSRQNHSFPVIPNRPTTAERGCYSRPREQAETSLPSNCAGEKV